MYAYKYLKKGKPSLQITSEQAKSSLRNNKPPFQSSAIQRAKIGMTSDRGASQEKRVVFDNRLSADNGMGNEGVSDFDISGPRASFGSWTSEQRNAHAYTRGSNNCAASQKPHSSSKIPHTVQTMRGSTVTSPEISADKTNESVVLKGRSDVSKADTPHSNRSIHHVKFKKIASAVIQREKLTDKVTDIDTTLPPLTPNPKPTIVFETMTTKSGEAQSVFNQTLGYSGNTICIVGLNQQVNDFNDDTREQMNRMNFGITDIPAPAAPEQRPAARRRTRAVDAHAGAETILNVTAPNAHMPLHILKCFKFNWKKPSRVSDNAQYKMPFVEARLEVMKQAKNLPQELRPIPSRSKADYSHRFIYRWIDGDAMGDTSEELADNTLQSLGEDELWILSGSYSWRSGADSTKYPTYTQFIQEINYFEGLVRRLYFEYKGTLDGQTEVKPNLPDFLPRGNINGYYFPETTLMLSDTAHNLIIDSISKQIQEGDGEFLLGSEQSKESMRMLELSGISRDSGLIRHSDALKVTKPLKNEFNTENGSTPCYLGSDFLTALAANVPMERKKFEQHLRQMRQSVFDMFSINDNNRDAYNSRLELLITGLYSYYSKNSAKIRDELRAILMEQKQKSGGGKAKKK